MADTPYMKTADTPGLLEKQIEDLKEEVARLSRRAEASSSAMLDVAREHPTGTSGVLAAVGVIGFAIGWLACSAGRDSGRSRYWQ